MILILTSLPRFIVAAADDTGCERGAKYRLVLVVIKSPRITHNHHSLLSASNLTISLAPTMEVNVFYVAAIVAALVLIYRRLAKDRDYFHEKPIPSMAWSPVLGSTAPIMLRKVTFNDFAKDIYDKFAGVKVFGIFDTMTRIFVLRDPELIKKVAVKDFEYFIDRRPIFGDASEDGGSTFLSKTLVGLRDQKWRHMRATLSPAFTGSKMRAMFELIVQYGNQMDSILRKQAASVGYIDYEVKDLFSRAANDIIATCAFGLQVESLDSRENEFYMMGKSLTNFRKVTMLLRVLAIRFFPKLSAKLGIDIFDKEKVHYFYGIIEEAMRTREAQGIVRPDMIHLMMQAKKGVLKHSTEESESGAGFATVEESDIGKASIDRTITDSELMAQCLIFFLAGFDTISTSMTFLAYELALHPDVQQKLYEEIVATNKQLGGKPIRYEIFQRMKYMDMVVSEALRLWSPPAIDRVCVRDYVLDDGEGLRFTIDKGTCVWFPIYGIHRDPKYYPNPDTFDPERFSDANRANIDTSTYMPFGVGPRNCIGSRFALMEMKAIMYQLLLNFSIERTEQTQVPLRLLKGFVAFASEKGVHLRLKLRQ